MLDIPSMLFTPCVFTGARNCGLAWLPPNAVPLCRPLRVSPACSVDLWVCQGLWVFLACHVLPVPRSVIVITKITLVVIVVEQAT